MKVTTYLFLLSYLCSCPLHTFTPQRTEYIVLHSFSTHPLPPPPTPPRRVTFSLCATPTPLFPLLTSPLLPTLFPPPPVYCFHLCLFLAVQTLCGEEEEEDEEKQPHYGSSFKNKQQQQQQQQQKKGVYKRSNPHLGLPRLHTTQGAGSFIFCLVSSVFQELSLPLPPPIRGTKPPPPHTLFPYL